MKMMGEPLVPKAMPGQAFTLKSPLPCGCGIARDEGRSRLRLWYCPAHAFTFRMLEILQLNLGLLDLFIETASLEDLDLTVALEAERDSAAVIRKATEGVTVIESDGWGIQPLSEAFMIGPEERAS